MLKIFFDLPLFSKIEILFYPFFLIYRMPRAWILSLWRSRVLMNGGWSRYMGFHPHNSINSLFYRTQWINLNRYGRSKISPILGLGNFPLKNWFYLSLPATYVYANAGAVTTLGCTLVWIFSHFLWLGETSIWWAITVTLLLFFSSTSYVMAFVRQNYQMLGWMWLPAALYFTLHSEFIHSSFAWFAMGVFGITPAFFAVPIVISISIELGSYLHLIVLLPIFLITISSFIPLINRSNGEGYDTLNKIAKLIGITQKSVRYDRGMKRLGFKNIYFILLYFISCLILSFTQDGIPIYPLVGLLLFLINQRFLRVADEQSLILIITSLFAAAALQSGPSLLTFLAIWLAFNPAAFFLSIQGIGKPGGDASILISEPFDHSELMLAMNNFLSDINVGEKVYFAFNDPNGKYFNVFDGYRVIHELPLNIASERAFHLFPDWWAVLQTNYEGAPQCWGRSVEDVIDNCFRWDAKYAIIYQPSGQHLCSKWKNHFSLISEFDWNDYRHLFRGVDIWPSTHPTPKWFLLRRNAIPA